MDAGFCFERSKARRPGYFEGCVGKRLLEPMDLMGWHLPHVPRHVIERKTAFVIAGVHYPPWVIFRMAIRPDRGFGHNI